MINPEELALVRPDIAWQDSYLRYIDELGDEERYPFPMDFEHRDFPALLQRVADFAAGDNLPAGYVPSTTLWLVHSAELLAVVNIRHYLNDNLRRAGGHIGLGVRPSARGQSLGSYVLGLGVRYARTLGIGDVHVHCYQDNPGSVGMIKRCGGQLDSEVVVSDTPSPTIVQRYIIAK